MNSRVLTSVSCLLFALSPLHAAQAQCPRPLTDDRINSLVIGFDGQPIDIEPGAERRLVLTSVDFGEVDDYAACASWSIDPPGPVSIDASTAVLRVASSTPSGYAFSVVANVDDGRRYIVKRGVVYRRTDRPIVGTWSEVSRKSCRTGEVVTPQERLRELVFHADGTFHVTVQPFEVYKDYWGTYIADSTTGRLTLQVTGGNRIFEGIDGYGRFRFDDSGHLILTDLSFGAYPGDRKRGCQYVFARS
jgi:hypothetical protein